MNYFSERVFIRSLLQKGKRYTNPKSPTATPKLVPLSNAGCYIISRKATDRECKLGKSRNLYERISSQYKICYPASDHFFCRYFFITTQNNITILEDALLKGINSLAPNSYSKEWVFQAGTPEQFEAKLKQVLLKPAIKAILQIALKLTPHGFIAFSELTKQPFPPSRVGREVGAINRYLMLGDKRIGLKKDVGKPRAIGVVHRKKKVLTPAEKDKLLESRAKAVLNRAKAKVRHQNK